MEGGVAVEIVDRIDRVVLLAPAATRAERRLRRAVGGAGAVHEIEFELQRDHRSQAAVGEALKHALQRGARFAAGRRAVFVAHGREQLQPLRAFAPDRRERAGNRPRGAVGIAVAEATAERVHHLALDVHQVDRARQLHAGVEQPRGLGQWQALAAHRAGDVDHDGVDAFQTWMGGHHRLEFHARGIDESGPREGGNGRCLVHRHIIGRPGAATNRHDGTSRDCVKAGAALAFLSTLVRRGQ